MTNEMTYSVFAGGEELDGRYDTYEDAELAALDVAADFPDLEVGVDVSTAYMEGGGGDAG